MDTLKREDVEAQSTAVDLAIAECERDFESTTQQIQGLEKLRRKLALTRRELKGKRDVLDTILGRTPAGNSSVVGDDAV